jgi:hypothetical protein
MMGLMDEAPNELEVELLREMMRSLKSGVCLKILVWKPYFETDAERVRVNFLMQGDQGSTVKELFAALESANLEFVSLLDFWCAHPNQAKNHLTLSDWSTQDWQQAQVHLHPQLKTRTAQEKLIDCINSRRPFEISQLISLPAFTSIVVDSHMAACLLPLWEGSQPFRALVERWQTMQPVNVITLEPVSVPTAFNEVKQFLSSSEIYLYVLLELPQSRS